MRRYEIAVAMAGLLLGVMATTLLLAPRLQARFPEDVLYSAVQPITLTFNRRIALESAGRRFELVPPVSGHLEVNGNRLLFTPSVPLEYGQTYTVRLASGLRGENSLPLLRGATWQFRVAGPNLLYLRLEPDGRNALWLQALDGSFENTMLTGAAVDVWDYVVTNYGRSVLISNVAGENGDELLLLDLASGEEQSLLSCAGSHCRQARPQPAGQLIAYERVDLARGSGLRQVWLLDTANGATWPAHPEELLDSAGIRTLLSHSPRWSADGRYLAYFKPDAYALVILDLVGGIPVLVPANINEMGEWSPVAYRLSYTEFFMPDSGLPSAARGAEAEPADEDQLFAHLVLFDLNAGGSIDMSEGLVGYDGPAVWHPDGEKVAFTRSTGGGGRQIWLFEPASLQTEVLTSDTLWHHSALRWSPDGRYLAFMRSAIDYSVAVPSLWLYDQEMGSMAIVASDAFLPQWQP